MGATGCTECAALRQELDGMCKAFGFERGETLVPLQPTRKQIQAGTANGLTADTARAVYVAMVGAAQVSA